MMHEFNGLISECSDEWFEIQIGGENLVYNVDNIDGCIVKLNYYISNSPIDKEKAIENMLSSFYEGKCEADATYCSGSSWTGIYSRNDDLKVGGHDIKNELFQHLGKYCYLTIETK